MPRLRLTFRSCIVGFGIDRIVVELGIAGEVEACEAEVVEVDSTVGELRADAGEIDRPEVLPPSYKPDRLASDLRVRDKVCWVVANYISNNRRALIHSGGRSEALAQLLEIEASTDPVRNDDLWIPAADRTFEGVAVLLQPNEAEPSCAKSVCRREWMRRVSLVIFSGANFNVCVEGCSQLSKRGREVIKKAVGEDTVVVIIVETAVAKVWPRSLPESNVTVLAPNDLYEPLVCGELVVDDTALEPNL